MKIEGGKFYQNSKGLIRYVEGFETKKKRWGNWEEVVYYPVSLTGKHGAKRTCALSTMSGWAKREWDPEAANYISPLREKAATLLANPSLLNKESARILVDHLVAAAKEELRRELGLETGHGQEE
ncbi:hypothetical protein SAMN02799624_05400 [Paenibacillus sp. UNC496MF]|uniref:hypothetical protein n=1 Tax=Paenibacillus sp. UNC496MF TaxID=1502753 RepID=UPI0008E15173|nr:hypothetical protein [Paenibacillus sp. UNC496MF]SFJ65471.1 hypothetical protein SAMN02799624_05400 [Paenibacillus sp. UNC496MF]